MRKLVIILAFTAILCGGCGPKEEIVLTIPGTTAQIMMRLIPAGTFMMGSPQDELDRESIEGPRHQVTIAQPFYMGIYEVTQEQWEAVKGTNPSHFSPAPGNPVEMVGWDDCQDFITELNSMDIGTFRLPTEAEWEYACRAGSTTRFSFGDDLDYERIEDYAWYHDNSANSPHSVGNKESNPWGLYDMHGNVWEWCSDWHEDYLEDSQTDPTGPLIGTEKVIRGGSYSNYPQICRSAFRSSYGYDNKNIYIGFRIVKTAP